MTAILGAPSAGKKTFAITTVPVSGTAFAWSNTGSSWEAGSISVFRQPDSGYAPITLTAEPVSGAFGTTLTGTTTMAPGENAVPAVYFASSAPNTGTVRIKATDAAGHIAYSGNFTVS